MLGQENALCGLNIFYFSQNLGKFPYTVLIFMQFYFRNERTPLYSTPISIQQASLRFYLIYKKLEV